MYFTIVKGVVEQGINDYIDAHGIGRDEVLTKIRTHMDHTSQQHRQSDSDPDIDYGSPLCRLGYIYRHAGINATLFEWALAEDMTIENMIEQKIASGNLTVASLGGGPGTELLGLAKYLSRRIIHNPFRINFTVLDNVNQWAETWIQLAKASEQQLETKLESGRPTISPQFLRLDALEPSSYSDFTTMFKDTDIVVCNYLFSENKTKLDLAGQAIARLADAVSDGCSFVVIDRLEQNTSFVDDVVERFQAIFGPIQTHEFAGTMDSDEQVSDLGTELLDRLGHPRLTFRTRYHGLPTVFWFTVQK